MTLPAPPSPWRLWLLPLLWTATILAVSGDLGSSTNTSGLFSWLLSRITPFSPETILVIHGWLRKAAHVLAYGLLFVLWHQAFWQAKGARRSLTILAAWGLCLAVALLDEGRQGLSASRTGSLGDVALDMMGVAFLAFWTAVNRKKSV